MFEHADREKKIFVPQTPSWQPTRQAPPCVAPPRSVPIDFRKPELSFGAICLRRVKHVPKYSLYDKQINSHMLNDVVKKLMEIVEDAAATPLGTITHAQSDALRADLNHATQPTSEPDPNTKDLLTILFDSMINAKILLEPAFVNEIKKRCITYVNQLNGVQGDTRLSVQIFLDQWNDLDSNFHMKRGVPTDYLYQDIADVMPLLSSDNISTTNGPHVEAARNYAADLVRDQVNVPLTAKQLRQILLELNSIYAPQRKYPYKQGFRYHSAQIGQESDAIGTAPTSEVEQSVDLVIEHIMSNLKDCETQLSDGKQLTDEMLKTVIATSAMAYQLLISIHPFADGNGRTCRMFANYILMHYHLLPATFSKEDAKQSMYNDRTDQDEKRTMLKYPQGARAAMVDALATSYDSFHPRSSTLPHATVH